MNLSNTTKIKGLYTYGNELNGPDGSLVVADNVNIDEPSTIIPRRGFSDVGVVDPSTLVRVKQLMSYKKTPLRHIEDRIEFLANGDFSPFYGSYEQLDPDIRIKFQEANSNLYFTTKTGIKKISAKKASDFSTAQGYIVDAGVPKALDCFGKVNFVSTGWLPPQSKVAYKVLFGKKDVNNNLLLGTPSSRYVVTNTSQDAYNYERTYFQFLLNENYLAHKTTVTPSNYTNTNETNGTNPDSVLLVSNADNANQYAFWFNKGTGVAPAIPGFTNVEVNLVGLNPSDNVGPRIVTAASVAGITTINIVFNGSDVIFTNLSPGISDGVDTPNGTPATDIGGGWAITITTTGTDSNYIGKWFIVHTVDKSYCFYYGNSSTINTIPSDPSLVGMTFTGILISNNSVKSYIANQTNNQLQNILSSFYTIELNNSGINPVIIMTDVVGGDIPDSEQGSIVNTTMLISVLNQGTITEGQNATVFVTFTVPAGIDSTFFYQIYRTPFIQASQDLPLVEADPGEDCYLVYESPVTDPAGTKVTVEDITPETFRQSGTPLYNNPNGSEGILQSNDQPPIAKDICNYKGFTFYANTSTFHRFNLDLISVDTFVSDSSQLVMGNNEGFTTYTFRGEPTVTEITCGLKQDTIIHTLANPDAKIYMYSALDETKYVVYFDDGTATVPTDTDAISVRVNISDLNPTDNVAPRMATVLSQFIDFIISTPALGVFTITNSENGDSTSIDTPNGTPATDIGTGWSFNETAQGTGEDTSTNHVLLSGSPSVALRLEKTARSLVNVVNADPNSPVNATYISGLNDIPGKLLFESRTIAGEEFYLATRNISDSGSFSPELPSIGATSFTAIAADGATHTLLTYVGHPFTDQENVYIALPNTSPVIDGNYIVEVVDADTIRIQAVYGSGTVTDSFYFFPFEASDNLAISNRIYWSKLDQPEAVPIINYLDIGTRDEPIERILSLRDYLFVLKTDGIFMLSGYSAPFTVRQIDTERIYCPDSAAVLNNQIYMLSNNSILTINDNTPFIISRMIEDKIQEVLREGYETRRLGFGVAYDDDRAYLLWLPTDSVDEVSTQCFRYNILEKTWTRWTKTATCGLVIGNISNLYIGDGDRGIVMRERKKRDRTDFADKNYTVSLGVDAFYKNKFRLSDVTEIEIGDVITQTQLLDVDTYNRLLEKLDIDTGLNYGQYFETFNCKVADNIASLLTGLNMQLIADDDSGVITSHTFSNTDWVTMRNSYNALIAQLNNVNCDTVFKDYLLSEGELTFEYVIESVDYISSEVFLGVETVIIQGNLEIYKHIKTEVQFNPIHFGDPSAFKQISNGYLLFDQNNFYRMTLEYSSDLSPSFEGHTFLGKGVGFWGYKQWGFNDRNYWGGSGNDAPRRVIIPRNKQRCRYITVKFNHGVAREFYKVVGVAHDVRAFSNRAYKGV